MPGHHTNKRAAKPVATSKSLKWGPDGNNTIAEPHHGSYDVIPKRGGSAKLLYHPKTGTTPRPRKDLGVHRSVSAAQAVAEQHHATVGKSAARFPLLMSLDDYYDAVVKDQAGQAAYHVNAAKVRAPDPNRTAHVDRPPPSTSDVSSRPQNERRKFPRKMKPTVRMKPISDSEAMAHLRTGAYNPNAQKALRWLVALKALATGYGKASGGGALKAANRGRSMPLLGPSGRTAGKPGGHYRKRGLSGKRSFGPDGRPGPRSDRAKFEKHPRRLRRAVEASSLANVVIKSEGAEMSSQNVDFDDLFKSELASDHLVDCPHCDAPITKDDLAKAHKGKGAVTHQSGPKHGRSSAHVRDHNPEGGTTRGGDGRGVHKPSRGVPGAKKTDPAVGVQNGKGSRARKGGNDDASSDAGSDDVDKSAAAQGPDDAPPRASGPAGGEAKKSVTVRGTDWVRYVDDGSDAALAKSISEGVLGGTNPTRPLDLNNDLTRLLT